MNSIPQSIGPYVVRRILGEGATAVVYLAEQADPPRRAVALKSLKSHIAGDSVARFEREMRTLAVLNHPNIAGVFDFAAGGNGTPYLTMEYVEGEGIAAFCDLHRLPLRDRIELFLQVCDAVQYVHQNGIIHRDLKPSNVLVSMRDGRPVAKLIDFGIAKLNAEIWNAAGLETETGRVLGTLCYMSPEQAGLADAHVDTRADVYSLGVLLYEVLAGTLPFEPPSHEAALPELLRRIREDDPEPPSRRVARGDADAAAAARGMTAPRLRDALKGDLDWIVMKAIDKRPERRYMAASDLKRDLEAHLSDRPVAAGPVTPSYRLQKAVRRHRRVILAAMALVLALALSTTLATLGYLRLDEEHRQRVSLLRLAERVQVHVANAHLWFEEKLSGDPSVDLERDVYGALDDAASLLAAASPGDEELARELAWLRRGVEEMRRTTAERWSAGATAGGPLDQAYDEGYRRLLRRAEAVKERFEDPFGSVSGGLGRTLLVANAAMLAALLALGALTFRLWTRARR